MHIAPAGRLGGERGETIGTTAPDGRLRGDRSRIPGHTPSREHNQAESAWARERDSSGSPFATVADDVDGGTRVGMSVSAREP
jgi:hypothetical protein